MKKVLTKDITRYDSKMKLRMDKRTFKAAAIGLMLAVPIYFLIDILLGESIIAAIFAIATVAFALLVQVGTVDGIVLSEYISHICKFLFVNSSRRKHYDNGSGEPYRIKVLTAFEKYHTERRSDNEKNEGKRHKEDKKIA